MWKLSGDLERLLITVNMVCIIRLLSADVAIMAY